MSNETIKLEADCAVATYHHHHHHHPHQNPHLQLHHNPIAHHQLHHHNVLMSHSPVKATELRDACEQGNTLDADEEQENKHYNNELKPESCNRGQMHLSDDIKLSNAATNNHVDNSLDVVPNGEKYIQLESVDPNHHQTQRDAIHLNQNIHQMAPSYPSSSDSSESSEDEDDADSEDDDDENENRSDENQVDDEDEEEEEDDEEEDDDDDDEDVDDEDDDDDESQDHDCDDIVDPVGHHHYMQQGNLHYNGTSTTNGSYLVASNEPISDEDDDDDEEEEDDDVSFENDSDETQVHNSSTADLLNSERMLEVTRKLVRSTERDPDRDLRKQVLLRTAIRRLPHYMECSPYSESFDQNSRSHNNTMSENNHTLLECLSPSQYYEHHNVYHLESQPKSYYHSVQPNAIQMSTTSLRMLDLNDDQDAEIASNAIEIKHHQNHHMSFETVEHENDITQTSLKQQQSYANSNIYNQYSQQHSQSSQLQDHNLSLQNDQQTIMHDFNRYSNNQQQQDQNTMIARHGTLENLYQPLSAANDSSDELASPAEPAAFQDVHNYARVSAHREPYSEVESVESVSCQEGSMQESLSHLSSDCKLAHDSNVVGLDDNSTNISSNDDLNNNHDHEYNQKNDCNQNRTTTTAYNDSDELSKTLESLADEIDSISPSQNDFFDETISRLHEDQSSCLETGLSQSSTSSDDSINSSSQSNDSAGDINGTSILETSLNSSTDYHYNSHDSGVILSPVRSNKRTSSSIGLDDEMEIDNLSDLTNSNQVYTGSIANHCKKLRKREIMD